MKHFSHHLARGSMRRDRRACCHERPKKSTRKLLRGKTVELYGIMRRVAIRSRRRRYKLLNDCSYT